MDLKRRRYSVMIAFTFVCLSFVVNARAAPTVTLAWDAPTQSADGTPITDLAGFRIYMAFSPILSLNPDQRIAEVPPDQLQTTVDVGALPSDGAVVYFRATAYDTSGNESALSNEVFRDFLAPYKLEIRFQ